MTAAAAKYKRQGKSKNIAADAADAAAAAHMLDEDEITKGHQETNQAAATECAEGEASAAIAARRLGAARGPAAAAATKNTKNEGGRTTKNTKLKRPSSKKEGT